MKTRLFRNFINIPNSRRNPTVLGNGQIPNTQPSLHRTLTSITKSFLDSWLGTLIFIRNYIASSSNRDSWYLL